MTELDPEALDMVTTEDVMETEEGSRSRLTASSVVFRYTGLSKLIVCKDLYQNLRYRAMPKIASKTRAPEATPMATPAKKPSFRSCRCRVLTFDRAEDVEGPSLSFLGVLVTSS